MPITKQRTLDTLEIEWGTYVERFRRLPPARQIERVRVTGYESFRDLLAHILAWWEEGMGVILAVAEGRTPERKRYDFDAFNAEAVARYRSWDEAAFMAHFEDSRRKVQADIQSLSEEVFANRRVRAWLNGIIFQHAREHLLFASRFLVVDLLENEWAEYVAKFQRLDDEAKKAFLSKQGFETFHDLLAHIVGWWEEGARVISGILDTPGFAWTGRDVDLFNRELVRKYSSWSEADLVRHYEIVRLALIDLAADLPDDAFLNRDIGSWLAEDVIEHYDEHALPV